MDQHAIATTLAAGPVQPMASKLRPPVLRPGIVTRSAALEQADPSSPWSVLTVVAGAGYGKSTVLHQVADRAPGGTAWLTLDGEDNDLTVLLSSLAMAVAELGELDPRVLEQLDTAFPPVAQATRAIVTALAEGPDPALLVLDDLHVLANPACLDVVDTLLRQATPSGRVAVGSRHEVGLAVPRLRAEGRLVELGTDELAMDPAEAVELAAGAGVDLGHDQAARAVATTEGWPVALYLAARAGSRGSDIPALAAEPGHERAVAEYVQAELLSTLDADTLRFLVRSSVLDRMSGPSCDAVLRTFGSGDRLRELTESNLLVVPLDEERTWFRYHQLFRDLLRTELDQHDPDLVAQLARRAADWYEAQGMVDEAVEYAMVSGERDRVAELVGDRALQLYRSGRLTTMERWFAWFDRGDFLDGHPMVAMAGGWTAALLGDATAAERRMRAATRSRPPDRQDDEGDEVIDGLVALLRAMVCLDGLDAALEDARRAHRLVPSGNAWRGTTLAVLGMVHAVRGAPEEAEEVLAHAIVVTRDLGAAPALSVSLAERGLLALSAADVVGARSMVREALEIVESRALEEHPTSGIVFAAAARMAARDGDLDMTRRLATRAQSVRPRLNHAVPHLAVQTRLELAAATLALSDTAGARTLLREMDEIVRLRPGLGRLESDVAELREQVADLPMGLLGSSSLTTAELRLLPLLRTHFSFREIGESLFLSPNTVKTQAISIYRKLGVTSRSDAVRQATRIGLLDG